MIPKMWASEWHATPYSAKGKAFNSGDVIQIDKDWEGPDFIKGGLIVKAGDLVNVVEVRPDGYIVARFGREEGLLGGSGCFARVLLSVPLGPKAPAGPVGTDAELRASQPHMFKASPPGPPAKRKRAENPSESQVAPQPLSAGPISLGPIISEIPPEFTPVGQSEPITEAKGAGKGNDEDVMCHGWMRDSHGLVPASSEPIEDPEKSERASTVEEWPNDWLCECGARNFEWRSGCFKCNTPRPQVAGEKPHLPAMTAETFDESYSRMTKEGPGSVDAPTLQSMELYLTREFKANGRERSQWRGGNSFEVWDEYVESCLSRVNRVKLFRLYELSANLYHDFIAMIPGTFRKFDSYVGMALSQHIDLAGIEISDEELDRRADLKEAGVKIEATVCQWGDQCKDIQSCPLIHAVKKDQSY